MYNLKSIRIQATTACNLKCKHCFAEAGKPKAGEVTIEDFQPVLGDLEKMRTQTAVITGGEPLLRRDFVCALASELTDLEIVNVLYSNMTLFNRKTAELLQKSGVFIIHTSIDAPTAIGHDAFRGQKGSFEKTIKSIKLAKKLGFKIWARTTLMDFNVEKIPKILELMLRLKVDSFRVRPVITLGRTTKELVISKEQLKKVDSFLLEKKRLLDGQMEIKFLPFCFDFVIEPSTIKETIPCFETQGYIGATGEIKPCAYYPVTLGNIRQDSLFETWNCKKANEFRKKTECPDCSSCRFYSGCHGGCRAAAFCRTGAFSARDPLCLARD